MERLPSSAEEEENEKRQEGQTSSSASSASSLPAARVVSLEAEDFNPTEVLLLSDPGDELTQGEQLQIEVQLPVPGARVFNNLAEYYSRTFARKKEEEKKPSTETPQMMSAGKRPLAAAAARPEEPGSRPPARRGPKRDGKSVLDRMADHARGGGPLSLLTRAMAVASDGGSPPESSPLQLRILVRRRRALHRRSERFSWISCQRLIAFDKHLNLALAGAVEQYDVQLPGEEEKEEKEKVVVSIRKCTRQLFVRGDTVVLVSLVESGK